MEERNWQDLLMGATLIKAYPDFSWTKTHSTCLCGTKTCPDMGEKRITVHTTTDLDCLTVRHCKLALETLSVGEVTIDTHFYATDASPNNDALEEIEKLINETNGIWDNPVLFRKHQKEKLIKYLDYTVNQLRGCVTQIRSIEEFINGKG